jgi:hypothetical protein
MLSILAALAGDPEAVLEAAVDISEADVDREVRFSLADVRELFFSLDSGSLVHSEVSEEATPAFFACSDPASSPNLVGSTAGC